MASARKRAVGRLCGLPVPFNLSIDEIHRFLRLGSGLEDQPIVRSERLQLAFDVGGALVESRRDPQLNSQKTRTDLRDQFLERVSCAVLETLDPVEPRCTPGPVGVMPTSA